ncbi:GGDEF domain-containing protein [Marinomonas sp. IMCC 4694]|uniref:GGDEF domain-containing protein n=1 Tax=Marinomonas sp. IMCC 4694 TaxID=2605432 RepID=UPI0011E819D9|nr:GGDEF domain-containing protein [Marinomonas sp. IMCC 4694]TYL48697.1 GGDEF domain-containing protein [Marinomonas sp. IMCC 4694]
MDIKSSGAAPQTGKDRASRFSWLTCFFVGTSVSVFSDDIRRVLIINLFTSVGVLFAFPLGLMSLFGDKPLLGVVLLSIALLYAANHAYLRRTHNHAVSGKFVIYPLYILMVYLVYSGGVNGTGHVWVYCVPAVALFLNGFKRGLIEMCFFTFALAFVMFFMDSHFDEFGYHESLKSRILFSFVVVIFLSGIYEYSTSRFNLELKETSDKLKILAYTDALTGLLNRRGMLERLASVSKQKYHLLLADVDYFKRVNDQYGHDAGDYVLTQLGHIIQTSLSDKDLSSRWGGEEFLIAVFDCNDAQAFERAEFIRQSIEAYSFDYAQQVFKVTLSVGLAQVNQQTSLREAITLADTRLYHAKSTGRNQSKAC